MPQGRATDAGAQALARAALERFELLRGFYPYSPLYGHLQPDVSPVPAQPRSVRLCPAGRQMQHALERLRQPHEPHELLDERRITASAATLALLDNELRLRLQPLVCKSWRCTACRSYVARQDAQRIEQALALRDGSCVVGVCTLPRRGPSGVGSRAASYDAVQTRLKRFLRLLREQGVAVEWCATVEQHADGVAHLNLILSNVKLYELATDERTVQPQRGKPYRTSAALVGFLRPYLREAGFGRCSFSKVRNAAAVAEYVAKTESRNVTACADELAKSSQVPTWAPQGYRRLRSSIRFLPKRTARTVGYRLAMPLHVAEQELAQGRLSHIEERLHEALADRHSAALVQPLKTSREQPACTSAAQGATVAAAGHERTANTCRTTAFPPPYPAPAPRQGGRVGGTAPERRHELVPAGVPCGAAARGRSALSSKGTSERKQAADSGGCIALWGSVWRPEQREGRPRA